LLPAKARQQPEQADDLEEGAKDDRAAELDRRQQRIAAFDFPHLGGHHGEERQQQRGGEHRADEAGSDGGPMVVVERGDLRGTGRFLWRWQESGDDDEEEAERDAEHRPSPNAGHPESLSERIIGCVLLGKRQSR
jgi:hypothetical protein